MFEKNEFQDPWIQFSQTGPYFIQNHNIDS